MKMNRRQFLASTTALAAAAALPAGAVADRVAPVTALVQKNESLRAFIWWFGPGGVREMTSDAVVELYADGTHEVKISAGPQWATHVAVTLGDDPRETLRANIVDIPMASVKHDSP